MATVNTIGTVTQENGIFYDKVLLKRLVGSLQFAKYAQKRNVAKHNGTEVDMRRFNSLAPATTPLSEGVTPDGKEFTVTSVRATLKQYGDYVTVSDVLDMTGLDPVITEMAEVLGEQAAETIDSVIKEEIFAGTTVQYAGGAAGRDSVTGVLTGDEVMKAVRTLRNNKAKPVVGGYYIGYVDPYCAYDLMKDPLWQDVSKYSNKENIEKGMEVSLEEIKENIEKRDYNDMHKEVGSLTRCEDAIYIDSTNLTIDEVVEKIKNIIEV